MEFSRGKTHWSTWTEAHDKSIVLPSFKKKVHKFTHSSTLEMMNQSKDKPHPSWNFSNVFFFFRKCILSRVMYIIIQILQSILWRKTNALVKFQVYERERTKAIARHTITNAPPQAAKPITHRCHGDHGEPNAMLHAWDVTSVLRHWQQHNICNPYSL